MPEVSGVGVIAPGIPQTRAANATDDPARVRDAACQFESLLMSQLMKSMHDSGKGWLGDSEDDQAGETATQLAEEQFAQALARQGGLGLAHMVVSGLEAQSKDSV